MPVIRSLIEKAYKKCGGIIADGETPPAALMQSGFDDLKMMLDSWSLENLMSSVTMTQDLTWPGGEYLQTVGPTGDIVAIRPTGLKKYCYVSDGTYSKTLVEISEAEFLEIFNEDLPVDLPSYIYLNPTVVNATISLAQIPASNITLSLVSPLSLEISSSDSLSTTLNLPPGYEEAIIYNLAARLCPGLGIKIPVDVISVANGSRANIKRFNNKPTILRTSLPKQASKYSIYEG